MPIFAIALFVVKDRRKFDGAISRFTTLNGAIKFLRNFRLFTSGTVAKFGIKSRLTTRLCDEICNRRVCVLSCKPSGLLAGRLRRAKFDFNICKNPLR